MSAAVLSLTGSWFPKKTRSPRDARLATGRLSARAVVICTARAIVFSTACFLAVSHGAAKDRYVLREATTIADYTKDTDPLRGEFSGRYQLVSRDANGVVTAWGWRTQKKTDRATWVVDPRNCKAQYRYEDPVGKVQFEISYEWIKPPEVWEVGQAVEVGGKVVARNASGAVMCFSTSPMGWFRQVGPSRPPDKNPLRTTSPGWLIATSTNDIPQEATGVCTAVAGPEQSPLQRERSKYYLVVNFSALFEFNVYYRYESVPDATAPPAAKEPGSPKTPEKPKTPGTKTPAGTTPGTKTPGGTTPGGDAARPPAQGGGAVLSADTVSAWSGEMVWVPIRLTDARNVANMNFDVSYDPRAAQLVEVFKGEVLGDRLFEANPGEAGLVRTGFAGRTAVGGTGRVMALRFRVTGAAGTTVPIRLSVREANDLAGAGVPVGKRDGAIEIRGGGGPGGGGPGGGGPGGGGWQPTTLDAGRALKMSVRLLTVEPRYDVNNDGGVTARDAAMILQQTNESREQ